jgi:putative DNA methylase
MTTDHPVIAPKKLIEVALPLDAINAACAREKSIRHGHPSTLHLWWARRPLAAARAVIFSQMVNDPEDAWRLKNPGREPNKQEKGHWTRARQKLFEIIEDLVKWENTTNEEVLERAREEIRKSWRETCDLNKDHPQAAELFDPEKLPAFHDPFAGGGAIPLEAQRLGLESYASDLNPVAVLINKAMIEIPPKFAGREPVNPEWQSKSPEEKAMKVWKGAEGLAADVRYYGKCMRDEAEKRIGHLYPKVEITAEMAKDRPDLKPLVGKKLTVIAWLWARTVKSPNPAAATIDVPLANTFVLSSKEEHEAFVRPNIANKGYSFSVEVGPAPEDAKSGTSFGKQKGFRCLITGSPISYEYIREEALAGRLKKRLMAIVAEGDEGRVFISPLEKHESTASSATPPWKPELRIPAQALGFRVQLYGMQTFGELFTERQATALATLSDLVDTARDSAFKHAKDVLATSDSSPLRTGGVGPTAYAEAVSVYLAFAVDKTTEGSSVICTWSGLPTKLHVVSTFGRQALPMTWDFAEANVFADSSGNFERMTALSANAVERVAVSRPATGAVSQANATEQRISSHKVVSTDPPYYDNIGYSDLSDFFYVWLRRSLRTVYPDLLATMAVPKSEELIASPFRHESKLAAEQFFLSGMTHAMASLATLGSPSFPITIYYAFKQSETETEGTANTGWETFLEAVIAAGLAVTGTWPMRTERAGGFRNKGQNALASSIVLVCRKRSPTAETISRRQFIRELNATLPQALDAMTRKSEGEHSPVAPVDLSQAIIGPGMAVFSKYAAVLEADGSPMTVRTALQLINRFLAEDDFDADTQFCLHWFEQHGWENGKFGEADTLARAKGTSVDGVKNSGVLQSAGGNVRLLKWADYKPDWDPAADDRLPVWEGLHQLVRVFKTDGESAAGKVLSAVAAKAESIRQLAYRLYTLCERAGRAEDARAYNELITSWAPIESAAAAMPSSAPAQKTLFE